MRTSDAMGGPKRGSVALGLAFVLVTGCSGSLARHADSISDLATRERVARALTSIEALEREGWLTRLRGRDECPREVQESARSADDDDIIGTLGDESTAPAEPECARALGELRVARAERGALEDIAVDPRAAEAWTRAMSELHGAVDDCDRDESALAAVAAALRFYGDVEPGWTIAAEIASCSVATLAGASAIPEPSARGRWFVRGCIVRGAGAEDACATLGADPRSADFAASIIADAGAPSDAPVAYVEIGAIAQAYAFVVVFVRGTWRVVHAYLAWTT